MHYDQLVSKKIQGKKIVIEQKFYYKNMQLVGWWILMACQPVCHYFKPRGEGIMHIVALYLHIFVVNI